MNRGKTSAKDASRKAEREVFIPYQMHETAVSL
jgi:hypothetical protein